MELLTLFAGALGIAAALAASIDPIMTTVTLQAQPADPGDLGPNEILKIWRFPNEACDTGKDFITIPVMPYMVWCVRSSGDPLRVLDYNKNWTSDQG